jgi:hypothetical protein
VPHIVHLFIRISREDEMMLLMEIREKLSTALCRKKNTLHVSALSAILTKPSSLSCFQYFFIRGDRLVSLDMVFRLFCLYFDIA